MIDVNLILPKMDDNKTLPSKNERTQNSTQGQEDFLSRIKAYENTQSQKNTQVAAQNTVQKAPVQKLGKSKSLSFNQFMQMQKEESTLQDATSLEEMEVYQQQIVSVLMQLLNFSQEEVSQMMIELDIQPIDLLDQNSLLKFLNSLYKDTPESELLFDEETVEKITQLTKRLNTISETIQMDGKKILLQKVEIDHVEIQANVTVTQEEDVPIAFTESLNPNEYNIHPGKTQRLQNGNEHIADDSIGDADSSLTSTELKVPMSIEIPIYSFHNVETRLSHSGTNHSLQHAQGFDVDIPQQIISKIEISVLKNHQEMTMELTPKELGKLSLKLTETGGVITANIKVDNEKVKDLVLSSLGELKAALEKQGISVGSFDVDVRKESHYSHMEKQKQKSSKRINELISSFLKEEEIDTSQIYNNRLMETEVDYIV